MPKSFPLRPPVSPQKKQTPVNNIRFVENAPRHEILQFRASVRRTLHRPITLANISHQHSLYGAIRGMLLRWVDNCPSDSADYTTRQTRVCASLQGMLSLLDTHRATAIASIEVRTRLEGDLWALCAPILLSPSNGSIPDDRILSIRTGTVPDETLRFYLECCTLVTSGTASVVCLPRWLYQALQATPPYKAVELKSNLLTDICLSASTVLMDHSVCCVEIPSPDVLVSTLKLWSDDKNDLYHDLDAAIVAASHLG